MTVTKTLGMVATASARSKMAGPAPLIHLATQPALRTAETVRYEALRHVTMETRVQVMVATAIARKSQAGLARAHHQSATQAAATNRSEDWKHAMMVIVTVVMDAARPAQ